MYDYINIYSKGHSLKQLKTIRILNPARHSFTAVHSIVLHYRWNCAVPAADLCTAAVPRAGNETPPATWLWYSPPNTDTAQ